MEQYKKVISHILQTNQSDAALFNYDAYVLKKDKRIATNHIVFEPEQLKLMDPQHPFVKTKYPKEITQVPIEFWRDYIAHLKTFHLKDKEHVKCIRYLLEHVEEHKYNALAYFNIIYYIEEFQIEPAIVLDPPHYANIMYNYCLIDFLCPEHYIHTLLDNPHISQQQLIQVLQNRAQKQELSDITLRYLANHNLLNSIDFIYFTPNYQNKICFYMASQDST